MIKFLNEYWLTNFIFKIAQLDTDYLIFYTYFKQKNHQNNTDFNNFL